MKKIILVAFLILMSLNDVFAQCAMCRASVESTMSNGRNYVATGLNTGIFYLFMAPYLFVAVIGFMWYKSSLKEREKRLLIKNRIKQFI